MNQKKRIVILGGGIGGLSAGYFLGKTGQYEVTIIEKDSTIGGMCSSFIYNEFILDYGPHKLYSVIPGILDEIKLIMNNKLLKCIKRNKLFLKGHLLDYPLKFSNLIMSLGIPLSLNLGAGFFYEFIKHLLKKDTIFYSYKDYIIRQFGKPAYELVFEPLADKVWGDPSSLHPDMARARIPSTGGLEVIFKLLGILKESGRTSAEFFYYPQKGFGDFPDTLQEKIEKMNGKIFKKTKILKIDYKNNKIQSIICDVSGNVISFPCDILISSINIKDLCQLLNERLELYEIINSLDFRHLVLIYIFIRRSSVLKDHWIFFPEKKFIFSRISEQKLMNPNLFPTDKTVICCDFTCSEDSWQWQSNDEILAKKSIDRLVEIGLIKTNEVIGYHVKRKKNFYPRYDLQYDYKMQILINKLKQIENLLLTGRVGFYNYNNVDHCMDMGRFISNCLLDGICCSEIMDRLRKHIQNYRIID